MTLRATFTLNGDEIIRLYAITNGESELVAKIRGKVSKILHTMTAPWEWYIAIETPTNISSLWVHEIQREGR